MADDACCLQGNSTLFSAASAGDRILRVANVAGFGPGQAVTLDSGDAQETATIDTVGTGPAPRRRCSHRWPATPT